MFILYGLVGTSLALGLGMGVRLQMLIRLFTRPNTPPLPINLEDLPTVSVCIPARNETHAMTQCLERVVTSTYPKLEIIVLDDNSVDNTSILIKSFAHAGVRFVEGAELVDGWLGKNHAQQELYRRASGEYILYLDVDTHLKPRSIDAMVGLALAEQSAMVSVLPTRDDSWRASTLFATLRHLWSVMSHTKNHPASTSSAWLIKRDYLEAHYDGFDSLKMAVRPEDVIARQASVAGDYQFLISTPNIGVSYEKKWRSQCETSIRLLYPFFNGNIFMASLGVLLLGVFLAPFIIVPVGLVSGWSLLYTLALAAAAVTIINYVLYVMRIWRSNWLTGGIIIPFILAQEIILLIISVYAYTTNTVTWKGRPVQQSARKAASR